jgi:proteasome lid subunit RPN8/RPN11
MKGEAKEISCGKRNNLNFGFLKGMKTSVFKYLCVAAMLTVASCFMTGCQKDENTTELKQIDEISLSKEYEEYIVAHLNFYNELQNITAQKNKIAGNGYSTTTNNLNIELFDKIFVTYGELIYKYPKYDKLDANEKSKLFDIVSVKSKEIVKLLPIENRPVRLKDGAMETPFERYVCKFFSNYLDAFMACFNYSNVNGVESGGLVLPDGDALFVVDKKATSTSMSIPGWAIRDYRTPNTITFHFHPGGNPYPSSIDSTTMENLKKHDIHILMILTEDPADSTKIKTYTHYFY